MKIKGYTIREVLSLIDRRYGLGRLEYVLSLNWFNPFLTIYVNLRSFCISEAIKMPLFIYGWPRIYSLSGSMKMDCNRIVPGMIKFNQVMAGAPNCTSFKSEIYNEGSIVFRGSGEIGTGTKIRVAFGATLNIGNRFKITDMCNIGCLNRITIGDDSWIVHRCQVCDSNYHFVEDLSSHAVPHMTKQISIGQRCWVCNSSTIVGGAVIPDDVIVASNSFCSKDYSDTPPYSMIGGIPAKIIKQNVKWIKKGELESKVTSFYAKHRDETFYNN